MITMHTIYRYIYIYIYITNNNVISIDGKGFFRGSH